MNKCMGSIRTCLAHSRRSRTVSSCCYSLAFVSDRGVCRSPALPLASVSYLWIGSSVSPRVANRSEITYTKHVVRPLERGKFAPSKRCCNLWALHCPPRLSPWLACPLPPGVYSLAPWYMPKVWGW